jgi:hypothetical protein
MEAANNASRTGVAARSREGSHMEVDHEGERRKVIFDGYPIA